VSEERPLLPGQKDPDDLPRVVDSRLQYQGKIISLRVDRIAFADGGEATREIVDHPGAVVIAALDAQERIFLVDQYRHPVAANLLELPAGCLEPGEDPLLAAKRELREEVGLEAGDWTYLGLFYSSPGFVDERLHAYLARELTFVGASPDDDEDLGVVRYPVRALLDELDRVQDAKTLAALLLLAKRMGLFST
jgi:ADP-ribose pyrophosphatase